MCPRATRCAVAWRRQWCSGIGAKLTRASINSEHSSNGMPAAQRWSMVVLPSASRPAQTISDAIEPSSPRADDVCEAMLNEAIAATGDGGIARAEALLEPVRQQCPDSPGPYRELAGVRFVQH